MGQRTIKGAAQQRRAHLQLGHQGGNIKVACWDRSPDPPPPGGTRRPPRGGTRNPPGGVPGPPLGGYPDPPWGGTRTPPGGVPGPPRGGTRTPPGGVPGPPRGVPRHPPGGVPGHPPGGGYPDPPWGVPGPPRGGTRTPPGGGGTRTPQTPLGGYPDTPPGGYPDPDCQVSLTFLISSLCSDQCIFVLFSSFVAVTSVPFVVYFIVRILISTDQLQDVRYI